MTLDLNSEAIFELEKRIDELKKLDSENENSKIATKQSISNLDNQIASYKMAGDRPKILELTNQRHRLITSLNEIDLYPQEISVMVDNFLSRLFSRNSSEFLKYSELDSNSTRISFLSGVLKLLRENRINFREIVAAEIFSDFLDMAEHLLDLSYKDASAVIIGSVLEGHLRKLCSKNNIDLEFPDSKGKMKPKKASTLNTDLVAAGVYGKSDQAYVEAWQKTRNDAAHGDYLKYTKEQVANLLQAVKDFITRFPA